MADCIFCKIASGQIASLKVFESEDCFAFLDVGPLSDGHTLLIPKAHYDNLMDMPPDKLTAMLQHLPRLAKAVMSAAGVEGVNILQNNGEVAGQVVQHVHFHIIPRKADDGLGFRWLAGNYPPGRGEEIQKKITDLL